MCEEFGVDSEVGQVGMFVFNLAFAVVPLFFAPLSVSPQAILLSIQSLDGSAMPLCSPR